MRGNYFLEQRAAIHAGIRLFDDNWDIDATTYEIGYTFPFSDDWIRSKPASGYHDQGQAEFYSDLFPFQDAQNFLARDKELSEFTSTTLGAGASWEFGRGWSAVERGALTLQVDWIEFDYDDFRDLTESGAPVGEEPLYASMPRLPDFSRRSGFRTIFLPPADVAAARPWRPRRTVSRSSASTSKPARFLSAQRTAGLLVAPFHRALH